MVKAELEIVSDLSSGGWIKDSLLEWGTDQLQLGCVIPLGFESYISIRNSADVSRRGDLDPKILSALINILIEFTSTPNDCFHALWEGYGWMYNGGHSYFGGTEDENLLAINAHYLSLPDGAVAFPKYQLPNRNYILMEGPISEALKLGSGLGDWFVPQSPNLLWPVDQNWCVASEIDFDVTLVGGSLKLISRIAEAKIFSTESFHPIQTTAEVYVADN